MLPCADRYCELFDAMGVKYVLLKGVPWVEYNHMIVPVGPINEDYSIAGGESRLLLKRFPTALLVRYSKGMNGDGGESEWYAVVSDRFRDLDELSQSARKHIRKGLKQCQVRRLDAAYVASHGYEVFLAAYQRYKGIDRMPFSAAQFRAEIQATQPFEDIMHYWGVFADDRLIALGMLHVFDDIEANLFDVKLDPGFLHLQSSFALFHEINHYYLSERGVGYMNNGLRNLLHQTSIQDFLMHRFSFEKQFLRLNLVYRPTVRAVLCASYPARRWLCRVSPKMDAIYKLDEIRRVCDGGRSWPRPAESPGEPQEAALVKDGDE